MKIGIWGARADSRGLAHQTRGFARWLEPERVMGLDLTVDGMSPYACDWSGFAGQDLEVTTYRDMDRDAAVRWMSGLDVVLGAETFYRDEFPDWAREAGVATVLQVNPEFSMHWTIRLPVPDLVVVPTTWRLDTMPGAVHMPFPVDRQEFPFRRRERLETAVHVAGHRAMADRAGTRIVLQSVRHATTLVRFVIRSQSDIGMPPYLRARGIVETANRPDPLGLYDDADVLLLPRRYGGQSLVMNEALSCGLPVIALDRDPERQWPGVVGVPCRLARQIRMQPGNVGSYDAGARDYARAIDQLAAEPARMAALSDDADRHAASISWDAMVPRWQDLLAAAREGRLRTPQPDVPERPVPRPGRRVRPQRQIAERRARRLG